MNITLYINTSELVRHAARLEELSRAGLPVAIRGTLNKASFHVKQQSMPLSADRNFVKRAPNFFKANSKVVMAKGLNVNEMVSTVGFISSNLKYNNFAVEELEQQEVGGKIPKRTFIPMDQARGGGNTTAVRPTARLRAIKNVIFAKNSRGVSRREKFIRAAVHAGKGGFVVGNKLGRNNLHKILAVTRKGRKTIIKQQPLYSYDIGRKVGIKPTHFMREATLQTAARLNQFFIEEANRQIERIMKRR